jgi:hypothetical protein
MYIKNYLNLVLMFQYANAIRITQRTQKQYRTAY